MSLQGRTKHSFFSASLIHCGLVPVLRGKFSPWVAIQGCKQSPAKSISSETQLWSTRTWAAVGYPNRCKRLPLLQKAVSHLWLQSLWGPLWAHPTSLQTSLTEHQRAASKRNPISPEFPASFGFLPACTCLQPSQLWQFNWCRVGEAVRGDWCSGRRRLPWDEWGEPWQTGLAVLCRGRRSVTLAWKECWLAETFSSFFRPELRGQFYAFMCVVAALSMEVKGRWGALAWHENGWKGRAAPLNN